MKLSAVARLLECHCVTNRVINGAVLRCTCGQTFHCPSPFQASMAWLKHAGFVTDGPQTLQDEAERPSEA